MYKKIEGELRAEGRRIVIVTAEFNAIVTDALTYGALDAFIYHGGKESDLTVIKVPGAFEIPGAVAQAVKHLNPNAVVTLGAVIRGGTPHFDFVAGETSRGIARLSLRNDIPVIFGILTTNTLEQALERAGTKASNKGWEVMESALKMVSVYEQLKNNG